MLETLTMTGSVTGNTSYYYVVFKGKSARPEVPRGFQQVKVPRLCDNGPGWWQGCQPYAPAAFYPQEILLALISV